MQGAVNNTVSHLCDIMFLVENILHHYIKITLLAPQYRRHIVPSLHSQDLNRNKPSVHDTDSVVSQVTVYDANTRA